MRSFRKFELDRILNVHVMFMAMKLTRHTQQAYVQGFHVYICKKKKNVDTTSVKVNLIWCNVFIWVFI